MDRSSAFLLSRQTFDTVSKGGKLLMSAYLKYQRRRPPGDGRMGRCRGRQRKGCELIRFLSLHAPLPVLLLFSSSSSLILVGNVVPLNASTVEHSGGIIGTSGNSPLTKLYQSFKVTQFPPFLPVCTSKSFPSDSKAALSLPAFSSSVPLQDFHISFHLLIK